jgi:2,5-dichlorohydroquinone reductive dechlorinase
MNDPVTISQLLTTLQNTFPGTTVSNNDAQAPVLHLFHAANSICSQKIRVILAAMQQPYVSHQLNIFQGDTYEPNYVTLRVKACEAAGLPLASQHLGSTAVTSAGCDACVVPTAVYEDSHEILIDSQKICLQLVERNQEYRNVLLPEAHQACIVQELAIIDEFPNYQILASRIDKKHGNNTPSQNGFAMGKVTRCNDLIEKHADNESLVKAYTAKRDKELSAAKNLFDQTSMQQVHNKITSILTALNSRLSNTDTDFLFTNNATVADLFWGIELMRIEDLGMASEWADDKLPNLRAYYQRLSDLPCLDSAITQWEGARLK